MKLSELDSGKTLADLAKRYRFNIGKFPYFLLKERGLLTEAEACPGEDVAN